MSTITTRPVGSPPADARTFGDGRVSCRTKTNKQKLSYSWQTAQRIIANNFCLRDQCHEMVLNSTRVCERSGQNIGWAWAERWADIPENASAAAERGAGPRPRSGERAKSAAQSPLTPNIPRSAFYYLENY